MKVIVEDHNFYRKMMLKMYKIQNNKSIIFKMMKENMKMLSGIKKNKKKRNKVLVWKEMKKMI